LDPYTTVKLVLLLFLFLLSAFFASSEASLFSLTSLHLHKMREDKFPFAENVQRLLAKPKRLLITIIVGNEIVNVVMSTITAGIFIMFFGNKGTWLAVAVMAPVLLIFAEAIPKNLAKTSPLQFAAAVSPVMTLFATLAFPLVRVFEQLSAWILKPFGRVGALETPAVMEGEFRTLIDVGHEEGILDKTQRDLIHRVFDLEDTEVSEIMTPRVDIFSLSVSMNMEEIKKRIVRHGYSRIPLYGIDRDDIVGIIYAKDLLAELSNGRPMTSPAMLLRKPYFIPLEKSAGSLLKDFQTRKLHLAIIVDEYGGVAGLVTMEDILESLFGDIYDERDTRKKMWHVLDDKTMIVLGMMPIDDFNEMASAILSSEDYDTIGGYILNLFGKLPVRGEEVEDDSFIFRIEKMTKARIVRIKVIRKGEIQNA
jgi:putative hemolysin